MSYVRSVIAAVAVSSLPAWASAATIDIDAAGYELASGSDKSVSITADGLGFTGGSSFASGVGFTAFDAPTFSVFSAFDVTSAGDYSLAFAADSLFADTANASFGAVEVSLMDGAIEVLFENFTGTGVYAGVDALLVTYANANLTTDASGGLVDFVDLQEDTSTLRVQGLNEVAPIPLPAGLPLMLGGLACFAWFGRRKSV